jgi:hypothetical protein
MAALYPTCPGSHPRCRTASGVQLTDDRAIVGSNGGRFGSSGYSLDDRWRCRLEPGTGLVPEHFPVTLRETGSLVTRLRRSRCCSWFRERRRLSQSARGHHSATTGEAVRCREALGRRLDDNRGPLSGAPGTCQASTDSIAGSEFARFEIRGFVRLTGGYDGRRLSNIDRGGTA